MTNERCVDCGCKVDLWEDPEAYDEESQLCHCEKCRAEPAAQQAKMNEVYRRAYE